MIKIYIVKITSQGRLTIPIKIRRELGFTKATRAIAYVKDSKLTIEPMKDLLSKKSALKTNKKPHG